jgi:hypothetical protein
MECNLFKNEWLFDEIIERKPEETQKEIEWTEGLETKAINQDKVFNWSIWQQKMDSKQL